MTETLLPPHSLTVATVSRLLPTSVTTLSCGSFFRHKEHTVALKQITRRFKKQNKTSETKQNKKRTDTENSEHAAPRGLTGSYTWTQTTLHPGSGSPPLAQKQCPLLPPLSNRYPHGPRSCACSTVIIQGISPPEVCAHLHGLAYE